MFIYIYYTFKYICHIRYNNHIYIYIYIYIYIISILRCPVDIIKMTKCTIVRVLYAMKLDTPRPI